MAILYCRARSAGTSININLGAFALTSRDAKSALLPDYYLVDDMLHFSTDF